MALVTIKYGELASSEVMNSNFKYLDDKIASLTNTVVANQSSTHSNIANINSTVSTIKENMNNDVKELQKQ